MELDITVDTSKLNYALTRLALAAKTGLGPIIKQEAGNISKTIMLIVPPTTGKSNPNDAQKPRGSGWSKASQEVGFNAIKGDLFGGKKIGLFQRIGSSEALKSASTGDTIGIKLGWGQGKTIRILKKFWQPDASIPQMLQFHKQYRNNRGRISGVPTSAVGKFFVKDQMWINNTSAEAYYNLMKSRVGWHKAGFAKAAVQCGIRVPAWITKNAGNAGTVSSNFGENPYITATAKNVKIPNMQRYVDASVKIREGVTLQKIKRLLSDKAVNLGFAKVDKGGKIQYNEV